MSPLDLSTEIDDRLLAFERAADSRGLPDVEAFLPPSDSPDRAEAVRELVRVDMELRWVRGERPTVEDYLRRFPELDDAEGRAALAFEEYRQRLIASDLPSRDSYRRRYGVDVNDWPGPDAATASHGPTSVQATPVPAPSDTPTEILVRGKSRPVAERKKFLPEVGEVFAGFRLVRNLGQGAFARVYLAEQAELADRPVALKVVPGRTREVRTLARLQHTNIVPVFSLHRVPPLTALCMPFFGSTTLAAVLTDPVNENGPRAGRLFVEVLRRRQEKPATGPVPAAIGFLESASFVDAVLWIGERLADALAHAHERGIVHRDIKPANILLADDGQPMLLDFNLAEDGNEEAERARVGGTLPYMAPEHVRAFAGDSVNPDGRADVYSLGAVLYQLLAGRLPYPDHVGHTELVLTRMQSDRSGPLPGVRQYNPAVTAAVESIIWKCLAPKPDDRYPSAAALRDDLARQRADQPLRYAPEPSFRERVHKWVRRHPRLTSPAAITAYAAAFLLTVSALTVQLSLDTRSRRQDRERVAALQKYEQFLTLSDRVKLAAGSTEGSPEVLELGTQAIEQYRVTSPEWQNEADFARLPDAEREKVRREMSEVALLMARAADQSRADKEYATRLNELAARTGDAELQKAAARQRESLLGVTPAEISTALNNVGRGDYLWAYDLLARGRTREALAIVTAFVARNPNDFGAWFLKARLHDSLNDYDDARAAYATCVALRPLSAEAYASRGEMLLRQGRDRQDALFDLNQALGIDPNHTAARISRAIVYRNRNKFAEALADLDYLVERKPDLTRLYFLRAEVRKNLKDDAGAEADRREGMSREPTDPESFVVRGLARYRAEPEAALKDFRAAEALKPNHGQALVNQAWLLGEVMNRPEEAIEATDRLLKVSPDNQNARTGRAVLLARVGRTEEALTEARKCLAGNPQPASYFQAACVFAIVAHKDPKQRDEAVRLVATALLRGFGHQYVLTDPDLDALRGDERFRKIVDGVKVMQDLGK